MSRCRVPSVSTASNGGKLKRGRTRSTLRNLFGKLTRSTSQEIGAQFGRGHGIRSAVMIRRILILHKRVYRSSGSQRVISMGASFGGSMPIRPLARQFCDWSTELVCEWLGEVGFGAFAAAAERSIRSGRHLLSMTSAELERELNIQPPLYAKKLRCLLNCIERNKSNTLEFADRMDVHQASR